MQITAIELVGFKSFGKKTIMKFDSAITGIVGPNGSGKSNVAEAIRFVLGEQSMKSMRGKQGTDFIFKGSEGLSPLARASVTAIFDNRKKIRNTVVAEGVFKFLDYDEVRITREIYADGINEYIINDTKVRLKDVQELLSTVGIGTSGHHIISQGEADRVLNATSRERKEMVEDALGLKLYQWRIKDAEKKLEKTEAHLAMGELSRKEIAPHLHFLKKQVERIEARKEQTQELANLYKKYLKKENDEIQAEKTHLLLEGGSTCLFNKKNNIVEQIKLLESKVAVGIEDLTLDQKIKNLEDQQTQLSLKHNDLYKKILKLDAEETVLKKSIQKSREFEQSQQDKETKVFIEKSKANQIRKDVQEALEQISWRLEKHEYTQLPNYINLLKTSTGQFFLELCDNNEDIPYIVADTLHLEEEMAELQKIRKDVSLELELIDREVQNNKTEILTAKNTFEKRKDIFYSEEKMLYELRSQIFEIDREIDHIVSREESLAAKEVRFLEEIQEGSAIIGSNIQSYLAYQDETDVDTRSQAELHKLILRLKIKLEDSGVSNVSDILEEHKEATERDQFLYNEIQDLNKTKSDLLALIEDLKLKLDSEFSLGIDRINKQFNVFFTDMFGGGGASLSVIQKQKRIRKKTDNLIGDVDPEEEQIDSDLESGIEVFVNLPQKKVRDLSMLSGGERALTSIALLFAISQVNPPPFMVLDETDAALDEANARRYGKSLRSLAQHSKLIVITHNRETMNQADALYGVTVGKDGASKILSVRFDEASEYAK